MTSSDDPTERAWDAQIDQAGRAAAHEHDMATLRAVDELRQAGARIDRHRSADERARLTRHIKDERDSLHARFRECQHFSERDRERWADQAWAIARTADDDHAAIRALDDDLATTADTLRRALKEIADAITLHRSGAPDEPVLVRLHEARNAARSTVSLVRSRIAGCEHLAADVRQDWLRALPDEDRSLGWLQDQQAGTGLRGRLIRESESAASFTARARESLGLLESFVATRAAL